MPTPKTAVDGYAPTEEEARKRYKLWKEIDPFPDVAPTLLNSGDIADYVAATGMICPFNDRGTSPDEEDDDRPLKSASYEVNLLGDCAIFTGEDRSSLKVKNVKYGQDFIVPANSIAFVGLEPFFQLPDYIAVRFNLKIRHVYRGLLLGTGPLVDPGFQGRLWIPLHNLTMNDYVFTGGSGLVWMEFTKMSRIEEKVPDAANAPSVRQASDLQTRYNPFPLRKLEKRKHVRDYLRVADSQRPIRSSIPHAVEAARNAAELARRDATRSARLARVITLAGVAAIAAIIITAFQLVQDAGERTAQVEKQVTILQERLEDLYDQRGGGNE